MSYFVSWERGILIFVKMKMHRDRIDLAARIDLDRKAVRSLLFSWVLSIGNKQYESLETLEFEIF